MALLQEVPPWWAAPLAGVAGAEALTALTSRNTALPLRRALAMRWPELMKSSGGGANVLLVARDAGGPIVGHRHVLLRRRPERRVAQLARLRDGTVVVNYHGSARAALAEEELARLWRLALAWAGAHPVVLGGDLNLRAPAVPSADIAHVACRDVDHIYARGLSSLAPSRQLERRIELAGMTVELSDHPPLLAVVGATAAG